MVNTSQHFVCSNCSIYIADHDNASVQNCLNCVIQQIDEQDDDHFLRDNICPGCEGRLDSHLDLQYSKECLTNLVSYICNELDC